MIDNGGSFKSRSPWALAPTCTPLPPASLPALTSFIFNCCHALLHPTAAAYIVSIAALQPALRSLTLSIHNSSSPMLWQLGGGIRLVQHLFHLKLRIGSCCEGIASLSSARGAAKGIACLTALTRLDVEFLDTIVSLWNTDKPSEDATRMLQPLTVVTQLPAAAAGPAHCNLRSVRGMLVRRS